jgi:hypothetical protein
MRNLWLVFGLLLASHAFAGSKYTYVVRTAKHTYYVDVVNSSYQSVSGARVDVYESGDHSARVSVRADGYQDGSDYASISPNQPSVNVRVTLRDPNVSVRVVDATGASISGAWVDQSQFGASGDEYRVEVRMPSTGFTKFQQHDVRIDMVWGARVSVWGSGASRRVDIRIPRRSLGSGSFVSLRIRIPSDDQIRERIRVQRFGALASRVR